MKFKIIPLVAIILTAAVSFGQSKLPENFHKTKLANGLEVLVIEDHAVPLATIEIVVRNGAYTESPEYDGLSHLYEHMFFKANRDYPSQEAFMERVSELGIVFNGTTSDERVNYFCTLSKTKIRDGLDFMNSAIRYPLFLKQEMINENPVVDGEFQRNESNPFFFLRDQSAHYLWGELYSRKNTIGDHDIIMTATPEKMKEIQNRYYWPNNSMLAIAGDVNHQEIFKMAKEIFGDWKPSDFDPFKKFPIPEFEPLKEEVRFVLENENAQVPIFSYTYHGPDTRSDLQSTYAADVFSYILQQKTHSLQKDLVDSGLAFAVNVGYATNKYVGPIYVTLVPNPASVKEALDVLEDHMSRWDKDDYFTDEQMQTAKDMLAIDDAYSREQTSQFLHTVTYWWASADIDYYVNYIDNLQKVSREDIKKYVRQYVKDKPSVRGLMLPMNMREPLGIDQVFKPNIEPSGKGDVDQGSEGQK